MPLRRIGRSGLLAAAAALTAAAFVVAAGIDVPLAFATESSTVGVDVRAATATLAAPTALTAAASCRGKKNGVVDLAWTAPAPPLTAYVVSRDDGTGAVVLGSVGAATTSYADTAVVGATTYTYTVATADNAWLSPPATVTVTTARAC